MKYLFSLLSFDDKGIIQSTIVTPEPIKNMDATVWIDRIVQECRARKDLAYATHGIVDPTYVRPEPLPALLQHDSVEFKNYRSGLRKKALAEKYKPGNAKTVEYEESEEQAMINLMEDPIFVTDASASTKQEDIDVTALSGEHLWRDVRHYIQRKNIILDDRSLEEIEACLMDPVFDRKAYLKYSKTTRMLSKVGFIHKLRDESYAFSLEEPEKKHVSIKFFKK